MALDAEIGVYSRCSIHPNRPSVCREVDASWEYGKPSSQCDRARIAHGMAPLTLADWRWRDDGTPNPAFAFNRDENAGRSILIAGRNFGCGSSREHAPWALRDLGLRAIVSSEIADIFRGNALKNGLLPIVLPEADVQALMARPDDVLEIDIVARELRTPGGDVHAFPLDAFARTCLLEGVDEMGYLLARRADIQRYEERHHAR